MTSNVLCKETVELNQMKSKDIFKILKSDFFLQKIFNNLIKKKTLNIVKYNKIIKDRININIKDYKEYSERYSSIEIEIKPVKDKYGTFININFDEENEMYYHIYFDNNKQETKRNYIKKNKQIKIIKIILDYQIKSFAFLFCYCNCIESIKFKKFHRNNVTTMWKVFYECSSLKELNLSNFNSSNVTDMGYMFYGCSSLKELNLSNFNTNNVNNMESMFYGCSSLKELNISNLSTNNVNNMQYMFSECSSLKELNLSNFNTNNVTTMFSMFYGCSSLKELNISNLDISNVTSMRCMFYGCSGEFQMKIKSQYKNIKDEAFDK